MTWTAVHKIFNPAKCCPYHCHNINKFGPNHKLQSPLTLSPFTYLEQKFIGFAEDNPHKEVIDEKRLCCATVIHLEEKNSEHQHQVLGWRIRKWSTQALEPTRYHYQRATQRAKFLHDLRWVTSQCTQEQDWIQDVAFQEAQVDIYLKEVQDMNCLQHCNRLQTKLLTMIHNDYLLSCLFVVNYILISETVKMELD